MNAMPRWMLPALCATLAWGCGDSPEPSGGGARATPVPAAATGGAETGDAGADPSPDGAASIAEDATAPAADDATSANRSAMDSELANESAASQATAPAALLPYRELLDHEDRPLPIPSDAIGHVLLFVGEKHRETIEGWSVFFLANPPSRLPVTRVLDLSDKSRFLKPVVTGSIRLQSKAPIYLDWDGVVAKSLGEPLAEFTMVCLDPEDRVLRVVHEPYSDDRMRELFDLYGLAVPDPIVRE